MTDDFIEIWIDPLGNLIRYDKVWTLEIPLSTEQTISEEDAIQKAKETVVSDGSVINTSLEIKRPNKYWESEEPIYGINKCQLCWVIELKISDGIAVVWVNASDGNIVSGYIINQ